MVHLENGINYPERTKEVGIKGQALGMPTF